MFLYNADTDYEAARCCILNGLFSGYMLASQAIEKSLKALIRLECGKIKIESKDRHNPFRLKEMLKKDTVLDKYDDLLKKLSDHFKARYYDNEMDYKTKGASSEELADLDNLWMFLKEKLPFPNEVKFRTKFFSDLFDESPYWKNKFWIREKNESLSDKIQLWEKIYKEIQDKPYSD
ncbi:MAG: HEPN domain-containing protein [bacterium]|nr:HEPN domain-containing protein [bacterium]